MAKAELDNLGPLRIPTEATVMDALPEPRGLDLVCWHAPLSCHGDVLVGLANRIYLKS